LDFDWKNISADAKNLIENLIVVDPKRRLNTDGILGHLWLERLATSNNKAKKNRVRQGPYIRIR
jgi:serine/threonine protein kinase